MNDRDKKGFHELPCDLCQRTTWHYKPEGEGSATCCNHSPVDCSPQGRLKEHPIPAITGGTNLHAGPSDSQLRRLNRLDMGLWRSAENRKTQLQVSAPWAQDLFGPDPFAAPVKESKPGQLYCTFCGVEVSYLAVLSEKNAKIRFIREPYKDAAGDIQVRERVVSMTEELHACPDCVLNIRKPVIVRRV